MAKPFAKILFGLVAACVAQGVTYAQDATESFHDAITLIRKNQVDEGLSALRELVDAGVTSDEAFEIWKATDPAIFQMLVLEGGDYEKIARTLLHLAKSGRAEMSRDQDKIAELVQQAVSNDFEARNDARRALAADHGEFAVPALLEVLGDKDESERSDRAMVAVLEIGHAAVMPLIQALHSDNDVLRRNAAAALVNIGDNRAAAPLAVLAANDGSDPVRYISQVGLKNMNVGAGTDASELMANDAEAWLNDGVRDGDYSQVVWSWTENGLKATDVPAPLYSLELAKQRAESALVLNPEDQRAGELLARSYLAQVAAIEEGLKVNPDDPQLQELGERVGQLRLVAMSLGKDRMRSAVAAAVDANQSSVVEAAMGVLGEIDPDVASMESPVVELLDSEDSHTRYAAALALTDKLDTADTAVLNKVVGVLADAVEEEAVRAVLVVDANPLTQRAAREASATRGVRIAEASTGKQAVADFYNFPAYDVVVVSEELSDTLPQDVIALVRQRSKDAKIVLLATSEDAEDRFEGKVDAILRPEGQLTKDELIAQVNDVVDELSADRASATDIAVAAGHALQGLGNAGIDTAPAADSLANQLNRDDAVAIPAAVALSTAGGAKHIDALVRVLANEGSSLELRTASAEGLGGIFSRTDAINPDTFNTLLAIAKDGSKDLELRQAVVTALGKGKLAPGLRAQLAAALSLIAGTEGDS